MNREYSWKNVSTYRAQLMGVAIVAVMLVHANSEWNWPAKCYLLSKLCAEGGVGVDIFLFLSGIGLFRSLKENTNTVRFYKRRVYRILPVYFPIAIIGFALLAYNRGERLINYIINVLTLRFWINGEGIVWYISYLVPFYLVFPVLFRLFDCKEKSRRRNLVITLAILYVSQVAIIIALPLLYSRIQLAITRLAISVLGCYYGKNVSEGQPYRIMEVIVTFSVFVAIRLLRIFLIPQALDNWVIFVVRSANIFFVLFVVMGYPILVSRFPKIIMNILEWLGHITLELYLIHNFVIFIYFSTEFGKQNNQLWIYFVIILPLCILGAWGYSKCIDLIRKRIE